MCLPSATGSNACDGVAVPINPSDCTPFTVPESPSYSTKVMAVLIACEYVVPPAVNDGSAVSELALNLTIASVSDTVIWFCDASNEILSDEDKEMLFSSLQELDQKVEEIKVETEVDE